MARVLYTAETTATGAGPKVTGARVGTARRRRPSGVRRQDVEDVAGPGRGQREQREAGAGHDGARAELQAGSDPGSELPGPAVKRKGSDSNGQLDAR